jgi:GDP-4-dehydro-6-deoxy-D-mannose reductase
LLARGDQVWLSGTGARPTAPAILTESEWRKATWQPADVRRAADMTGLISASRPGLVVHLAGISFVPEAEKAPEIAHEVNVMGAARLLAAVMEQRNRDGADPVVLVVGSGTQYGTHDASAMPLAETAEQRPANVYADTKLAQERLALEIATESSVKVICTRSFGHSGVGHDRRFFMPAIVERIRARGPAGGNIAIGNDVVRDYLHIDDVVAAYLALAERGTPGRVYNVASGVGVSTREVAMEALRRAGGPGEVVTEPGLQRAADMPVLVGSPALLQRDTGWRPKKTYLDILDDLLAQS